MATDRPVVKHVVIKKRQPKPPTIQPYSLYWESIANKMARDFTPKIYPCAECMRPVISGYCCTACGSANPRGG